MRKINCSSQGADILVEKVTKYLQLLNGLGTRSPLRCMASQLRTERGKKGNECTREMLFMLSETVLSRAEERWEAGIRHAQRAIFCLYHSQHIPRITLVHVVEYKRVCNSCSGEIG